MSRVEPTPVAAAVLVGSSLVLSWFAVGSAPQSLRWTAVLPLVLAVLTSGRQTLVAVSVSSRAGLLAVPPDAVWASPVVGVCIVAQLFAAERLVSGPRLRHAAASRPAWRGVAPWPAARSRCSRPVT